MNASEPVHHVVQVDGMSCDHCVAAVTSEVGSVAGVDNVAVDLPAGTVTVVGGEREQIEAAIDEAGFDVV